MRVELLIGLWREAGCIICPPFALHLLAGHTAQYMRFMRREEEDDEAGPMDDDSEEFRQLRDHAKLRTAEVSGAGWEG